MIKVKEKPPVSRKAPIAEFPGKPRRQPRTAPTKRKAAKRRVVTANQIGAEMRAGAVVPAQSSCSACGRPFPMTAAERQRRRRARLAAGK